MGKYTKMALVLLYLLQLVVVFREQLVHLYKSALGSVSHGTEQGTAQPTEHGGLRAVFERVVHVANHPAQHAVAAAVLSAPKMVIHENHGHHHAAHPDPEDEKKDRVRRHRRQTANEYLIRNLFHEFKRMSASPAATDERAADIVRIMTFSCSSQPAA
jgi:hypothetical protein